MKRNLNAFIAERAEQLAVIYLTRHADLAIEHLTGDTGLDFLVTILRHQHPTGRVFGVQVKGRDKISTHLPDLSFLFTSQQMNYARELPFPVCIFLFSMEEDRGYYQWIALPSSSSLQSPNRLEPQQWHLLDEAATEQIVEQVNAWYKAKQHSAA